jgi:hypothetical protein
MSCPCHSRGISAGSTKPDFLSLACMLTGLRHRIIQTQDEKITDEMSTVTQYQAPQTAARPATTVSPAGRQLLSLKFELKDKSLWSNWRRIIGSVTSASWLATFAHTLILQRYVTKRWVSFLWRASLWPVPVTFTMATIWLGAFSRCLA